MYDGMINVCKEKGFTSHDVVANSGESFIRRKSAIRVRWIRMQQGFCRSVSAKEQSSVI